MSGRFAPSPTGMLHLGNLRTALLAWLAARSTDRSFVVRMEDLDRVQAAPEHERRQLDDLASIGLDWDGDVIRQSERFDLYRDALAVLRDRGLVYECFCTRREVRAEIEAASSAPHLPPGSYPGTCRTLTAKRRSAFLADGRTSALRLRASESMAADRPELIGFDDIVAGHFAGGVDDVVLQRNDGVPSYNLAVVVDDASQGVTQVVRGDDLLDSTPRQIHLQRLLGLSTPAYGHVPLVFGDDGERLSKRHGSVSLDDLSSHGVGIDAIVGELLASGGLPSGVGDPSTTLRGVATGFDLASVRRGPATFEPAPGTPATFVLRNVRRTGRQSTQ
ncbi:MAG: tRNA glutamyl-Q(34) synthetase GluQRS [Ilumatobacter sp.]|uniref:tRNA glutamyl-Q(34) synthetase GluQRS n=1 Tax=Ilumatobacter sp. TaxID=1967498 RepID=UPI0032992D0C